MNAHIISITDINIIHNIIKKLNLILQKCLAIHF